MKTLFFFPLQPGPRPQAPKKEARPSLTPVRLDMCHTKNWFPPRPEGFPLCLKLAMRMRARQPAFAVPATLHAHCRLHARASEPAALRCIADAVSCELFEHMRAEAGTRFAPVRPAIPNTRACRAHAFARARGQNTDV